MNTRPIKIKLAQLLFPLLFRPDHRVEMVRLGSEYGGWWVPNHGLDSSAICYLAGVGTDVSFDRALIERTGCTAWGFDPTPKAIDWFTTTIGQLDRYQLVTCGLAGATGALKFYAPTNPDHVSHSVKNLQKTATFFTADVKTVKQVMSELGHNKLELIKLDIEGAEHDTIATMIADCIRPWVICVEFDQPEPIKWAVQTVKLLRSASYGLAKLEKFNMTFIRRLSSP